MSTLAVPEVAWYYPRFRAYLHTYGDLSVPTNFRTLVSEMIFGLKTPFFGLNLPGELPDQLSQIRRISRRAMSAPSSGSSKVHAVEQQEIIDQAFEA